MSTEQQGKFRKAGLSAVAMIKWLCDQIPLIQLTQPVCGCGPLSVWVVEGTSYLVFLGDSRDRGPRIWSLWESQKFNLFSSIKTLFCLLWCLLHLVLGVPGGDFF